MAAALYYADASALVKLVLEEPESDALGDFLDGSDVVSSELVLTEVSRAIRRAVADDTSLPLAELMQQAYELLESIALLPLDRAVLIAAGTLEEPMLRALDAIHVAAAVELSPIEAFITYDERQSAAARLMGLRTIAPSVLDDGEGESWPSAPGEDNDQAPQGDDPTDTPSSGSAL